MTDKALYRSSECEGGLKESQSAVCNNTTPIKDQIGVPV